MTKPHFILRLLLPLLMAMSLPPAFADNAQSVLMVLSSYGREGGELQPGYEFDEFAKAYLVFRENRYRVDVASPAGGPVEADEYDPDKAYNRAVVADSGIMEKLAATLSTAAADPGDYAAVFIVGGKGAMFDLPGDPHLQTLIAAIYERGGVVSAVCHGPAALVNVRLSDGSYLVAGHRVNGFTNEEEQLFGKKWAAQFPFMLEHRLIERGANFESSPIMLSHVAVDGRLITGQNPFSTTAVASEVVRALGADPRPLPAFRDDATIALVARVLAGDSDALGLLDSMPDNYQLELVGMYGYYFLRVASKASQIEDAISLMEAANVRMQHPVLAMSIVEGHRQLGQLDVARDKARRLARALPDNEQVQALLASFESG